MKLFWLTAEMPFPPNTGGRIGMFKRIEYFSKGNEIFLFSIIDSDEDYKYKTDMLKYCKDVRLYDRKKKKLLNLLKLFLGPYVCVSRWQGQMKDDITDLFLSIKPDFIIVDFPQMLGNISNKVLKAGKIILNQHNTEYLTLRNVSKLFSNPIKRLAGKIESYRLQLFEKKCYRKGLIKLFTFVSTEDKKFFENRYGLTNTLLVPVGTEAVKLHKKDNQSFNISYIGKMEYPPNAEAAVWFAKNVFDKLKNKINNLKYYVVGKNPLKSVLDLTTLDKNIIVTGTVDNIDTYFEKSDIVVIPLFYGGGVKVKLLEELGHGCLVITKDKGIEGTTFNHNKELLVANSPDEFVDLCNDVFLNPEKYNIVKEQAFKCIENQFTWNAIINNFEQKLKSLL